MKMKIATRLEYGDIFYEDGKNYEYIKSVLDVHTGKTIVVAKLLKKEKYAAILIEEELLQESKPENKYEKEVINILKNLTEGE